MKIRLRFRGSAEGVVFFDNIRITGDPLIVESFDAFMTSKTNWRRGDLRSNADQDPDADAIPNLLEYAFQTDPSSHLSGVNHLPELTVNEDGTLTLSYHQFKGPQEGSTNRGIKVHDLHYVPQISFGDRDATGNLVWIDGRTNDRDRIFDEAVLVEESDVLSAMRVSIKTKKSLAISSPQVFARILVELDDGQPNE